MRKPTLDLDFDGVIHAYRDGWRQGQIYDDPVPGFFDWAAKAQDHFTLVIHSSRAANLFGVDQITAWLNRHMGDWRQSHPDAPPIAFRVQAEKPPAWLTIDDRAIRFMGNWADPMLDPEVLLGFKPWTQR